MDPSSAQQQEMGSHSLENMLVCSKSQQERKPRPQPDQALKCPRCDSTNTKFCYYNNYSLTQPRYFCKSCRRYWTKGGTLRNVPVGGGCRKNKRSSSSSSSSKRNQDQNLITTNPNNPLMSSLSSLTYDSNDLTLAFARLHKHPGGQLGFDDSHDLSILGNTTNNAHSDILGNPHSHGIHTFDALRGNYIETPNGYHHNLYYGFGHGNMGEVENCGGGVNSGEMGGLNPYEDMSTGAATTAAVTVTTMKQEFCNNNTNGSSREGYEINNNKVLWGFPWQQHNGGDNGNMGEIEYSAGRESWNGLAPSWHGLLNSPLM